MGPGISYQAASIAIQSSNQQERTSAWIDSPDMFRYSDVRGDFPFDDSHFATNEQIAAASASLARGGDGGGGDGGVTRSSGASQPASAMMRTVSLYGSSSSGASSSGLEGDGADDAAQRHLSPSAWLMRSGSAFSTSEESTGGGGGPAGAWSDSDAYSAGMPAHLAYSPSAHSDFDVHLGTGSIAPSFFDGSDDVDQALRRGGFSVPSTPRTGMPPVSASAPAGVTSSLFYNGAGDYLEPPRIIGTRGERAAQQQSYISPPSPAAHLLRESSTESEIVSRVGTMGFLSDAGASSSGMHFVEDDANNDGDDENASSPPALPAHGAGHAKEASGSTSRTVTMTRRRAARNARAVLAKVAAEDDNVDDGGAGDDFEEDDDADSDWERGGGTLRGAPSLSRSRSADDGTYGRRSAPRSRESSKKLVSKRSSKSTIGKAPASGSDRRIASRQIFRPSPFAMLAPAHSTSSVRANPGAAAAMYQRSTAPVLPPEEDLLQLPTKRSRGRKPPTNPELQAAAMRSASLSSSTRDRDEGTSATTVQIEGTAAEENDLAYVHYAGTTKTGKPKKIFMCKVPACGKCFKRSEHLKRHVRSIHTGEKRASSSAREKECQWLTASTLQRSNARSKAAASTLPAMTTFSSTTASIASPIRPTRTLAPCSGVSTAMSTGSAPTSSLFLRLPSCIFRSFRLSTLLASSVPGIPATSPCSWPYIHTHVRHLTGSSRLSIPHVTSDMTSFAAFLLDHIPDCSPSRLAQALLFLCSSVRTPHDSTRNLARAHTSLPSHNLSAAASVVLLAYLPPLSVP